VVKLIRRSCWLRAAFGLCIGALFSTISISDANAQRRAYQAPREFEELLVIRKPGAAPHALRADCAALGAEEVGDNPKLRMHRIRVPKHRLEAVKRHLERRADVEGVEENRRFEPESIPDDPLFSSQWHLPLIGADRAWDQQPAGAPIVIAILDTGIDLDHPDLAGQLVPGSNTFDGGSYEDYHGHGTRVAGVAGATAFNAEGVASVAWNARIMPIRVTADSGSAFSSTLANALVWAADNGARVANMSFQSVAGSSTIQAAARYFVEQGGVVFAGAGNLGREEPIPETSWIISVSGTDQGDQLASFSSWGDYIDVAAPGRSIKSTTLGGGYGSQSGTSFAGPVAAGVAALVLAVNPALSGAEVESVLEHSAVDLGDPGWDPRFGHGRVNAAAAVYAAWAVSLGLPFQCNDGLDNDGDGLADWPEDPDCERAFDYTESPVTWACGLGFELALILPLVRRRLRFLGRLSRTG
jgi:subtilisin family serine protease